MKATWKGYAAEAELPGYSFPEGEIAEAPYEVLQELRLEALSNLNDKLEAAAAELEGLRNER